MVADHTDCSLGAVQKGKPFQWEERLRIIPAPALLLQFEDSRSCHPFHFAQQRSLGGLTVFVCVDRQYICSTAELFAEETYLLVYLVPVGSLTLIKAAARCALIPTNGQFTADIGNYCLVWSCFSM